MPETQKDQDHLILQGSSRPDGDTALVAGRLRDALDAPAGALVDLTALGLRPFDYAQPEKDDGLRDLLARMGRTRHLVFATPVYWYAMSAPMKLFFDRLTDVLLDRASRPLGRALAGSNVWLLATGSDSELPMGFAEPFRRTADYFDMVWRDACYVRAERRGPPQEAELAKLDAFAAGIRAESKGTDPGSFAASSP